MPDNLRISTDELKKRMEAGEDFVVIDTRNPQAWAQSDEKLPVALRVPAYNLVQHLAAIPKNKSVVAYRTLPYRASSLSVAQRHLQRVYANAVALEGGLDSW